MDISSNRHIALKHLVDTIAWIDERYSHVDAPRNERSLRAIGHFDNALRSQSSIALMASLNLHGSIDIVLRGLFEALVRGLWVSHCASDAELRQLRTRRLGPSVPRVIAAIEELGGFDGRDFHKQLVRRSRHAPNCKPDDAQIGDRLWLATVLGLTAATAIAEVAQDTGLAQAGRQRSMQFRALSEQGMAEFEIEALAKPLAPADTAATAAPAAPARTRGAARPRNASRKPPRRQDLPVSR